MINMGDSADKKSPSIPEWQKAFAQSSSPPSTETSADAQDDGAASKTQLLDQAKRFLEDESIRDASRERKVAFLEQKGLQGDDIQTLLGPASTETTPSGEEDNAEVKTIHDSSTTPSSKSSSAPDSPPTSSSSQTTASPNPTSSTPASSTPSMPPIITYPEFLLRPSKPPPLVTFQRLVYAAYGLAGFSALTYGTSKFFVQPMLESLSSARHDFASTTIDNLEKLNSHLEDNVSHVPALSNSALLKRKRHDQHNPDGENDDEASSIDSDPTELFHRDFATQTSPHLLSRADSLSSSTSLSPHAADAADPTARQSSRLSSLHESLTSLLDSTRITSSSTSDPPAVTNAHEHLKDTVSDLQVYLDTLQFSNNVSYPNYDNFYPGTEPKSTSSTSKKSGSSGDVQAEAFKAGIRSLKGALLSSRNFPSGTRMSASVR